MIRQLINLCFQFVNSWTLLVLCMYCTYCTYQKIESINHHFETPVRWYLFITPSKALYDKINKCDVCMDQCIRTSKRFLNLVRSKDNAVSVSGNTSGSTYPDNINFKPNIPYVYFQFEIKYCSYLDGRRHLTESRIRRRLDWKINCTIWKNLILNLSNS